MALSSIVWWANAVCGSLAYKMSTSGVKALTVPREDLVPWPHGHSWDMAFFIVISGLQYTRLLVPIASLGAGAIFWGVTVACLYAVSEMATLQEALYFCLLFWVGIVCYFLKMRDQYRQQLMEVLEYTGGYLGLLTHGLRLMGALRSRPDELRTGFFTKITFALALLSWQEFVSCGGLAMWAMLAFTPEFGVPGSGWPLLDVWSWVLMQAGFVWRSLAWCILHFISGVIAVWTLPPWMANWIEHRNDLISTTKMRHEWSMGRSGLTVPLRCRVERGDSLEERITKATRLTRIMSAAMQRPVIWERLTIPKPALSELLLVCGLAFGVAMAAASATVPPRSLILSVLAWCFAVATQWLLGLWKLGLWPWAGLAGVLIAVWVAAAVHAGRDAKAWKAAYFDTLNELVFRAKNHQSPFEIADDALILVHTRLGPCPTTSKVLRRWSLNVLPPLLGILWGCSLVGYVLYPSYLPAYAIPSYTAPGSPLWDRDCSLLICRGPGAWRAQLQTAAHVNLLAVRAWRKGGLDGVQVALEALRAARSGVGEREMAHALDTLRNVQLSGLKGVRWRMGWKWKLGVYWERRRPFGYGAARTEQYIADGVVSGPLPEAAYFDHGVLGVDERIDLVENGGVFFVDKDDDTDTDDQAACDPRYELLRQCERGGELPVQGSQGPVRHSYRATRRRRGVSDMAIGDPANFDEKKVKPKEAVPELANWRTYRMANFLAAVPAGMALVWLVIAGPPWLKFPDKFMDAFSGWLLGHPSKGAASRRKAAVNEKRGKKARPQPATAASSQKLEGTGSAGLSKTSPSVGSHPASVSKAPAAIQKPSGSNKEAATTAASKQPNGTKAISQSALYTTAKPRARQPSAADAVPASAARQPSKPPAKPTSGSAGAKAANSRIRDSSGGGAATDAVKASTDDRKKTAGKGPADHSSSGAGADAIADALPFTSMLARGTRCKPFPADILSATHWTTLARSQPSSDAMLPPPPAADPDCGVHSSAQPPYAGLEPSGGPQVNRAATSSSPPSLSDEHNDHVVPIASATSVAAMQQQPAPAVVNPPSFQPVVAPSNTQQQANAHQTSAPTVPVIPVPSTTPAASAAPPAVVLNPALALLMRRVVASKPAAVATPATPAAPSSPVTRTGGLWGNVPDVAPTVCVRCRAAPRGVGVRHGDMVHLCLCHGCGADLHENDPCPICGEPVRCKISISINV